MSDERYHPGFLSKEEYYREQQLVRNVVEGIVKYRDHVKKEETKSNAGRRSEFSNDRLGLIDELINILTSERENAVLDPSDKSKRYKTKILDISEGVILLKCSHGGRLERDSEIAFIKDKKLIGKGVISDAFKNSLWINPQENYEFVEGDEFEISEIEPAISYKLQLDLLEKIKRREIPPEKPPVRFFLYDDKSDSLPDEEDREELKDRKAVKENIRLDDSQVKAVEDALSLKDGEFLLIIGPPGTGKTKVIKKIAYELKERGKRVLITAHTNLAVDNAIENLPLDCSLRVGRSRKVTCQEYLLGYKARTQAGKRFSDLKTEIEETQKKRRELLGELEKGVPRSYLKSKLGNLNKKLRKLETERKNILREERKKLLTETPIIGCTLVASQLPPMDKVKFDTVIIDECSQASIPLALLSMVNGKRWILVGDHKQLLPIFKSVKEDSDLERFSVFNHLKKKYDNRSDWLKIAYRSNSAITNFSAENVYEGNISPAKDCDKIKLDLKTTLDGRMKVLDKEKSVVFIHVDGEESKEGNSRYNEKEIDVCKELVSMLSDCGIKNRSMGVIAPYRSQVRKLVDHIKELEIRGVEIKTVDSFQGREKDVIIFSVTATSDLSFVTNINRLNVALTRPRCKLIVVGNGKSIHKEGNDPVQAKGKYCLLFNFLLYAYKQYGIYLWNEERWAPNQ